MATLGAILNLRHSLGSLFSYVLCNFSVWAHLQQELFPLGCGSMPQGRFKFASVGFHWVQTSIYTDFSNCSFHTVKVQWIWTPHLCLAPSWILILCRLPFLYPNCCPAAMPAGRWGLFSPSEHPLKCSVGSHFWPQPLMKLWSSYLPPLGCWNPSPDCTDIWLPLPFSSHSPCWLWVPTHLWNLEFLFPSFQMQLWFQIV